MSNSTPVSPPLYRCPHCDSVVDPQARLCLMCGRPLTPSELVPPFVPPSNPEIDAEPEAVVAVEPIILPPEDTPTEAKVESRFNTPQPITPATGAAGWRPTLPMAVALLFVLLLGLCGGMLLFQVERTGFLATPTVGGNTAVGNLSPTPAFTPTFTPAPAETETPSPSETPAPTHTPAPTSTPQPPRLHRVESGESLISLSLRYGGITVDSIAEANSLSLTNPLIQVGQEIIIPWPTATPPLQAIVAEVGEDRVLVDPSNCPPFYEIKQGDTLFQLAAANRVPLDALLAMNYLTIDSVLQPGDVICIPQVVVGGILPPTPGPSPTPSLTPPPSGPRLLYPADGATVANPEGVVALQWLVVQDLATDEYYMVELTDLTAVDTPPHRAFTRQTSFQIPSTWRPTEAEEHKFRWQVSIVRTTGQRADGSPIYTYGGRASQPSHFFWLGAIPTATPTNTPTPTLTPTATPVTDS